MAIQELSKLSRREFLKLGGAFPGLLQIPGFLKSLQPPPPSPDNQLYFPHIERGRPNEAGALLFQKLDQLGLKYEDQGVYIYSGLEPIYSEGPFPMGHLDYWNSGFMLKIFTDNPPRVISHPDAISLIPDETFPRIIQSMVRFDDHPDNSPITMGETFALKEIRDNFRSGYYAYGMSVPPEIIIGIAANPYNCLTQLDNPQFGSNEGVDPGQPTACLDTSSVSQIKKVQTSLGDTHLAASVILTGAAYNNYKSKVTLYYPDSYNIEPKEIYVWADKAIEYFLTNEVFNILLTIDDGKTLSLDDQRRQFMREVFRKARSYLLIDPYFKNFTPFYYPELPDPFTRRILDFSDGLIKMADKFEELLPPQN